MIQIVEDNLSDPRVLRIRSPGTKIEVFVRQTRTGLTIRPEKVFRVAKERVFALAQKYLEEYPNERGVLPYQADS